MIKENIQSFLFDIKEIAGEIVFSSGMALLIISVLIGIIIALSIPFMLLWNYVIQGVFQNISTISILQSIGLVSFLLLCRFILFGFISKS